MDIAENSLDEKFDLVISAEVLEHIPDDISAIRHLVHMTGKYLIVSSLQGRMRDFEASVGHVRNYDYGELPRKLRDAGLSIRQVVEWGFPFYSPVYRDILNFTSGTGTTGAYGPVRKMIANLMYWIFMLNSSKMGDQVVVLAEMDR